MPVFLEWRRAAASDDLARSAVSTLATGALVILPTEVGYVLAAAPGTLANPDRPDGLPDTVAVSRLDGYFDAAGFLERIAATPAERALAARLWPGPVAWVSAELPYPAWVPLHLAAATVLAAQAGPLALFEINGGRGINLEAIAPTVALIVVDDPSQPGPITRIRPNDARWSIEQPGTMSGAEIRNALARRIVFVCTGNTCRSPMAEALFKTRLAERLGIAVEELPERGFVVSSAGIAATPNDPATPESAALLQELGIDLSCHRSRLATADLIARADEVVAMTRSHLQTLVARYPVLNGALRLFCGADGDLDDPIGGGPEVYRTCAVTVRYHVDRLITEMGLS